jgi:methyltransferase OMS1, mitochondrial
VAQLFHQRRFALVGAGVVALGFGIYVALLISSYLKVPVGCASCDQEQTPTGRPPTLDRQTAAAFDAELDLPERLMGVRSLRKHLAKRARGNVLEVAMGTGRNLPFYDWRDVVADLSKLSDAASEAKEGRIRSFTGVDISPDVFDVAKRKVRSYVPGAKQLLPHHNIVERGSALRPPRDPAVDLFDERLRFFQRDALGTIPAPPTIAAGSQAQGPGKYDTIIQTFGLCSVSDPVGLISNLATMVRPGSGRIFLVEHGQGYYELINGWLDKNAERHFQRYGCRWNRDIKTIVDDAVQRVPGLEVIELKRPFFTSAGTTYWIELKIAEKV